jgi:5-methylcytosine-specific restriction protein A
VQTRCPEHATAVDQRRGSAAQRGYGARWQRIRARKLRRNPMCERPGCVQPAVDVDHTPTRRELVAKGVADPDADQYLTALCHSHHSHKTAVETGFGRRRG